MKKNKYIIYESYTDETRILKNMRFNTKIVGIYDDKNIAIDELQNHIEKIQLDFTSKNNWYIKKYNKKLMKENLKGAIKIYSVFNDFIENNEEVFYVILEKVECGLNEKI